MKKTTGDQYLMKRINKNIVLEAVMEHAPISRADISALVGLNKGTVSSLVNELVESELIVETGLGESSGGRKPVMLLFNDAAGYAIGIDLGVNYILGVVTDLRGHLIHEHRIPNANRSSQAVIEKLIDCIQSLSEHIPESPYGLVGIGIGVPGLVDEHGNVLSAPNLEWANVPLLEQLSDHFDVPISVDNEANAGALGEKQFGAGRMSSHLLYISVGIGIGAGIVLGEKIYRGTSGFSGEVGHMTMSIDGIRCRCGNRGCWEVYASEDALLRNALTAGLAKELNRLDSIDDAPDLNHLIPLAEQGNESAIACFREIGQALGIGIANLIHIFNPERVVVGNRISLAGEYILKPLVDTVQERSLPYHHQRVDIALSELGVHSTALGAASMALSRYFSNLKASM